MKKLLSILLVLVLVFSFAACGSTSTETDSDSVELNALFMKQAGYSEEDVTAMTEAFTEETGIKVNLNFVAYEELEAKILTSAETGGYDVILGDCIWPAQFAKAGLVLDVTDRVKELDTDDIFEGAMQSCSYEGKYYGLPWLNDVKYMFVNKAMLEKAGITELPATWDELRADAKILKDKGIVEYPMVGCWSQAECLICDYTCIAGGFGGDFVDADNNPTMNSPENIAALQMMSDMLNEGLVNPKSLEMIEDDVLSTFAAGNAAFAINWTYQYNSMNDEAASSVVGDGVIMPIPGTDKAKSATVNGGMPLMITKGSAHPDEAWQYMTYISSKEVQAKYSANALPMWKSLYTEDSVIEAAGKEVVEASLVQYDYIKNRPMVPYYNELSTFMQTAIQKVLLGQDTAEAALNAIQDKALELAAK
ncbi:MAG: extracellular solute-binding protein [Clostridia bacterium]|nr:extracellular solute-binding protein [Clostridia bacterium]